MACCASAALNENPDCNTRNTATATSTLGPTTAGGGCSPSGEAGPPPAGEVGRGRFAAPARRVTRPVGLAGSWRDRTPGMMPRARTTTGGRCGDAFLPPTPPQGGRENCKEKRRHAPEAADQLGAASCCLRPAGCGLPCVLAHIGDKWRAQPTKDHACGFRSENAKRSVENEYLYGETISESQYSQSIKNEFCEQGNWTKKNSIKLRKR
jgi:hypothetical protein